MMKKTFLALAVGVAITACQPQQTPSQQTDQSPAYLDTTLDLDTRVADLVGRMTLDEKIAQLHNAAPAIERLGVPQYDYWNEALHGVARAGEATVFPQAIGMAAMWDTELMLEIATAISDEGRAKHHFFFDNNVHYRYTGLTFWSPNINIFRDPRWGRGQETYGEDPYLTGELGIQFIRGLQGDNPKYLKTAATAKHFAVHNGPEISRHSDNYVISNKDLYETYLPAFEKAIVDADVEAVMCAYNRVNGAPACGSDMLLNDILRGKYQFDGHVMSDCGAISDFYRQDAHAVTAQPATAAAWAVSTGTDMNCGDSYANLSYAVRHHIVGEDVIDRAVTRLFKTRFKLGMFDPADQVEYSQIPMDVVASKKHMALAEKATEQSLVLLKNDGILPLSKDIKVALIGPNADNLDVLLGNYNGIPTNPVTPKKGIEHYLGEQNVSYAPGSAIIADIYGHATPVPADVLFHRDQDGHLQSGLKGDYYRIQHKPITDFSRPRAQAEIIGDPIFSRIDSQLEFYWEKSPLDGEVMGEFGVQWQGVLAPKESGTYQFVGPNYRFAGGDVIINGEEVKGPVSLQEGEEYDLQITKTFLKNPYKNTVPLMSFRWFTSPDDMLDKALDAAKDADIVILAVGISPRIEGEEMPVKLDGFNYGDRADIDLPDQQQALIKALHALGKPVVLVNFSGSSMALNWEQDNVNAIIQAFYPGEATGTALAKILWGEANPSGRLPVTFYRNLDGFAAFDDYDMSNRTYKYFEGDVLYPFGYGLSYSKFAYSEPAAPASIESGQDLTVSVKLFNHSDIDGAEVTQLYVQMPDAPVRTPNVELKGFARTELAAQSGTMVTLTVPADELVYFDEQGEKQAYTGKLLVSVGSGQPSYTPSSMHKKMTITIK